MFQPIIAEQIVSNLNFFPILVNDWFNLDVSIRYSSQLQFAKVNYKSSFICTVQIKIFTIFDPKGLGLLTRLRLCFSHLHVHSLEIENTSRYLLLCLHFTLHRVYLMHSVKSTIFLFDSKNNFTFTW